MQIAEPQWWRLRPHILWGTVWAAMAVIGCVNLAAFYPVLASGAAMLFSLALVTAAGYLLLLDQVQLSRKMKGLVCIALASFTMGEFTMWLRWNGPAGLNDGVDFGTYYVAARRISAVPPKSPYMLETFPNGKMTFVTPARVQSTWQRAATHEGVGLSMQYIYPPLFAVLMKPVTMLPFQAARVVWRVLTLLFLCGGVAMTFRAVNVRPPGVEWLYLVVAIVTYIPLSDEVLLGQVGCFLMLLAAAAVWWMKSGRTVLSAGALALATAVKLTPVIAVPVMVVHRKWRWLAAYLVALLCISGISVGQAGWAIHRQFVGEVLPAIACGTPVRDNVSLFATVEEVIMGHVPDGLADPQPVPEVGCLLAKIIVGVVLAIMVVRVTRRWRERFEVDDVVLMLLATLPLSPISWRHQYTLALMPFLYAWGRRGQDEGDGWLLAAAGLVSTNVLGFVVALTDQHAYAIGLGAVMPSLLLVLVFRELGRSRKGATDLIQA